MTKDLEQTEWLPLLRTQRKMICRLKVAQRVVEKLQQETMQEPGCLHSHPAGSSALTLSGADARRSVQQEHVLWRHGYIHLPVPDKHPATLPLPVLLRHCSACWPGHIHVGPCPTQHSWTGACAGPAAAGSVSGAEGISGGHHAGQRGIPGPRGALRRHWPQLRTCPGFPAAQQAPPPVSSHCGGLWRR